MVLSSEFKHKSLRIIDNSDSFKGAIGIFLSSRQLAEQDWTRSAYELPILCIAQCESRSGTETRGNSNHSPPQRGRHILAQY